MLPYILYELTLFSPGDDPVEARRDLGWALEFLTQRDQDYLKQNPRTPRLYKSGVVYEPPAQHNGECEEVQTIKAGLTKSALSDLKVRGVLSVMQAVFGGERFRDIGAILKKGAVDCDNLATWRAAELRQDGVRATPYLTWRKNWLTGNTVMHALVIWPDGTSEDPSLLLGMGGAARKADRDEEIRKNLERCDPVYMKKARSLPALGQRASGNVDLMVDEVLGKYRALPSSDDFEWMLRGVI